MDAETGRILFGKNKDEQMPMASTTKIMTCIWRLKTEIYLNKAEVSSVASAQPKVKLGNDTRADFLFKRSFSIRLMLN